jgi:hypothetical protein
VQSPIARTYLSLAAFYASDPRRRGSRERDIGLWWRSRRGPTYRAAWVRETGELYLVQHGLTGPGGGSVHLVEETFSLAALERRLEGWDDVVGTPGSFEWLLGRLAPRPVRTLHRARAAEPSPPFSRSGSRRAGTR